MAGDNTVFTHEGHLSEAALAAVADGQESYLPHEVVAHLDGCDHCAGHLGDAAFLSAQVGQALAQLPARAGATADAHGLPPRWAIALCAVVACGSLAVRLVRWLRADPLDSASMLSDAAADYAALPAVSSVIHALQFAAPLVFLCAAIAAGMLASRSLARSVS